eukprot:m.21456 g.21456  ORF g.21456 m.21456 type:complete len:473 (+) comp7152_c0_seq1:147-1565(+)
MSESALREASTMATSFISNDTGLLELMMAEDKDEDITTASLAVHNVLGLVRRTLKRTSNWAGELEKEVRRDHRGGSGMGRPKKRYAFDPSHGPLWTDQFLSEESTATEQQFRDTFGVPRTVFQAIVDAVANDLHVGTDATGQAGMSVELAVLCTLRMCRTSQSASQIEGKTGFDDATIKDRFHRVIRSALYRLKDTFMQPLSKEAVDREVKENARLRFPGCAGKINSMKVTWGRSAHGFRAGTDLKSLGMIAIVHSDLTCQHLHFCTRGSIETFNLWTSTLYSQLAHDVWGKEEFQVQDSQTFNQLYFLTDSDFPETPYFIKEKSNAETEQEARYAEEIDEVRKTTDLMFHVVQSRFKVVGQGLRMECKEYEFMREILEFCFLVHNMVVYFTMYGGLNQQYDARGHPMEKATVLTEFALNLNYERGTVAVGHSSLHPDQWAKILRKPDHDIATAAVGVQEHRRLDNALMQQF